MLDKQTAGSAAGGAVNTKAARSRSSLDIEPPPLGEPLGDGWVLLGLLLGARLGRRTSREGQGGVQGGEQCGLGQEEVDPWAGAPFLDLGANVLAARDLVKSPFFNS
mmetsp:Transcript_61412/g.139023  ORF Transcript_61412/g.139023 Transcript_61412/m.139023 type:complete len:107 (+) Transcript_61412:185-505(+)